MVNPMAKHIRVKPAAAVTIKTPQHQKKHKQEETAKKPELEVLQRSHSALSELFTLSGPRWCIACAAVGFVREHRVGKERSCILYGHCICCNSTQHFVANCPLLQESKVCALNFCYLSQSCFDMNKKYAF